jgi:type II secretory pathway component PulJ
MKDLHSTLQRKAGATLAEILVGAAAGSIILGALMIGSIALQRSFSASSRLANSQADLVRVADYMARDIRNASNITPSGGTGVILTATIGDFYDRRGTPNDPTDDIPNMPILGRDWAAYGASPVTVRYGRSGNRVYREVSRIEAGATSTSTTWIADDVSDLTVTMDAQGVATISSASAMQYSIVKAGVKSPPVSYVLTSRARNPKR